MDFHNFHQFICVVFCTWMIIKVKCEHQEICDDTKLTVDCSEDQAILMESAKFGRMRIGKCVKMDLGYLGCHNVVLNLMDRWCSGRHSCQVQVSNPDLNKANTDCVADLNSYLEVDYACIPVISGVNCLSPKQKKVHINHGYVSSHVTAETGCGSPKAPWLIEAQSGQTIDLWLIDFGALDREEQSLYTSCHQLYGFIIERDLGVNLTMCGGTERKKQLYKSKTNKVEVHVLSQQKDTSRYFVQYTFIGCADLLPPAHAWYKRDGNEAVIGCKANDRIWRLYCNGNTWDGVVGNCSEKGVADRQKEDAYKFTFSTVILLTSVVCGAVLLIIIVIVSGAVYVKKQRIRHDIKLRSDYGMISQCQYYTLKSGYGMNTMSSANCQLPVDSQPLVHIVDKDAMDTTTSHNLDQPVARGTTSTSGNLI